MPKFLIGEDMEAYAKRRRGEGDQTVRFQRFFGSGGGTPFLPSNLVGLEAWYRYTIGLTTAQGSTSAWADQSGKTRDLLTSTAAMQPAVSADGSLLFNGSGNYMQSAAFAIAQPYTLYALFRQNTWTSADRLLDGVGVANTPSIRQTTAGASPDLTLNSGADLGTLAAIPLNTYSIMVAVANGVTSVFASNTSTGVSGDAGGSGLTGITLGASAAGSGQANIQVKELIVYSTAHNATERQQIINYLTTVGGL